MILLGSIAGVVVLASSSQPAFGADAVQPETTVRVTGWPQWRGPERNGVCRDTIKLPTTLKGVTLEKLWSSESFPVSNSTGYASPVVADGRLYQFINYIKFRPSEKRTIDEKDLKKLWLYCDEMEANLQASLEAARLSGERASLPEEKVHEWAEAWINQNIPKSPEWHKKYAYERLALGHAGMPIASLNWIFTHHSIVYDSQESLDEALNEAGITKATQKILDEAVTKHTPYSEDTVFCLDADTGRCKPDCCGYPRLRGRRQQVCLHQCGNGAGHVAGTWLESILLLASSG
jgi:hypothetical protein